MNAFHQAAAPRRASNSLAPTVGRASASPVVYEPKIRVSTGGV